MLIDQNNYGLPLTMRTSSSFLTGRDLTLCLDLSSLERWADMRVCLTWEGEAKWAFLCFLLDEVTSIDWEKKEWVTWIFNEIALVREREDDCTQVFPHYFMLISSQSSQENKSIPTWVFISLLIYKSSDRVLLSFYFNLISFLFRSALFPSILIYPYLPESLFLFLRTLNFNFQKI